MEFMKKQDQEKENKKQGSYRQGDTDIAQLMGNSAMLRLNGDGRGVIQREVEAGVSLYRVEERDQKVPMEALGVDTIKLTGRSKTGLKSGVDDAQGAHTIADTFIKKYQKEVVKGRLLYEAVDFYRSLFLELETDLTLPVQNEEDAKRVEEANKRVAQANVTFQEMAGVNNFNHVEWRKLFQEIIVSYNDAYAYSPFATRGYAGKGSGKGEGTGKARSKIAKRTGTFDLSGASYLLDVDSVERTGMQPAAYNTYAGRPAQESAAMSAAMVNPQAWRLSIRKTLVSFRKNKTKHLRKCCLG
ncbi:hypothetical protein [Clostridium sp. AM58-1XD]|uniref:hypothetical protein n=1 Tax=Clostridium sp. AM58-1XD TaxID=2292307 RepID=UPI000E4E7D86|nr:hypothetical protein [Clostridium sp. AM58-1XD]RGZ01895.1 hypothetical protein DXA13_00915 [Clostridium sp. AM58-1XD]